LLITMIGAIGVLLFASASASAALTQTPFGCRASVARVTLLNNITVEPYVANPTQTPCKDASDAAQQASVPTTTSGNIEAAQAGVFTDSAFDPTGATAPGATAVATEDGVTIPTVDGTIRVVGPIQAVASYSCVNDQLVTSLQSSIDVVYINNVATPVASNPSGTIPLGGGGAYIAVNQKTITPTSATVDALHIYIPNIANIVVDEAVVSADSATPCAGTTGVPPVLEICPPGSTLETVQQECVIVYDGKTIIVSRPFKGPSGGTVYALAVAKKKYPHSPCVVGAGPKFALIATKQGGRVKGTLYSDRIIAAGNYERVAGLGGNDCLDGIGKTLKLFDGNGKDRVYSTKGTNRIALGNGNDLVEGGSGRDVITVGNGKDRVYGKGGNDSINGGRNRDQLSGGPGKNRIFTLSVKAKVNCGPGKHNTAFLRQKAIKYAMHHGCTVIHHLQ
jgi:hypothetical protein